MSTKKRLVRLNNSIIMFKDGKKLIINEKRYLSTDEMKQYHRELAEDNKVDLSHVSFNWREIIKYEVMKNEILDDIFESVCKYFTVSPSLVKQKNRNQDQAKVRQITMSIAYGFKLGSHSDIAGYLFGQDHATSLHACKTVVNLCETNRFYKIDYEGARCSCLKFMEISIEWKEIKGMFVGYYNKIRVAMFNESRMFYIGSHGIVDVVNDELTVEEKKKAIHDAYRDFIKKI